MKARFIQSGTRKDEYTGFVYITGVTYAKESNRHQGARECARRLRQMARNK